MITFRRSDQACVYAFWPNIVVHRVKAALISMALSMFMQGPHDK